MSAKTFFHWLSYIQYPFMAIAVYYAIKPYIVGFETIFENYNNLLIFAGLGMSFSTLQDTTKTQNKLSRKIWENPRKGRLALIVIALLAFCIIIMGLFGWFISGSVNLKNMSLGIIVLGIGMLGILKSAIEMFDNHRLDKRKES